MTLKKKSAVRTWHLGISVNQNRERKGVVPLDLGSWRCGADGWRRSPQSKAYLLTELRGPIFDPMPQSY